MEPMETAIQLVTLVTLVTLVILVILVLVKWSRDLTLPILEPMKVVSQTIRFMTLQMAKTIQTLH